MAGKFNFRLEKVLDIRIREEDISKTKLRDSIEIKKNSDIKLENFETFYNKYNDFMNNQESIIEKKMRLNYLCVMNDNINNTKNEISNQILQIEDNREELKQKQIKKKTVQTLKEKQYDHFIKEENRIEQKNNDEFALYGFMRYRKQ